MKRVNALTFLAAAGLSVAPLFSQGVIVVQKETRSGQTTTTRTYMDKNHLRSEVRSGNDEGALIFDGTKELAQNINLRGSCRLRQGNHSRAGTIALQIESW